jgi:hypothetical protein
MARRVSTEEVAWHRHEGDVWVVVDGDVYDVTSFVSGATPLTSPPRAVLPGELWW